MNLFVSPWGYRNRPISESRRRSAVFPKKGMGIHEKDRVYPVNEITVGISFRLFRGNLPRRKTDGTIPFLRI